MSPLPVIAAGGFGDGRGLAAALVLGAAAISMGTGFVASEESRAHAGYKQRILEARGLRIPFTQLYSMEAGRGQLIVSSETASSVSPRWLEASRKSNGQGRVCGSGGYMERKSPSTMICLH